MVKRCICGPANTARNDMEITIVICIQEEHEHVYKYTFTIQYILLYTRGTFTLTQILFSTQTLTPVPTLKTTLTQNPTSTHASSL